MNKASSDTIYQLEGRMPFLKALPFGIQHILAMFVANIAPILIIAGVAGFDAATRASLIQNAMLIAGIGTIVQLYPLWRIGSGLPIVMGISFTFVSVLCVIITSYGYNAAIGAIIIGGIIEGLLGLFAAFWRRIIAPVVSACVVTAIGFSLLNVGAASFGGGFGAADFGSATNLTLGTITLIACLTFNSFAKGFYKQLSVLFGLIIGYITAVCIGAVDFTPLAEASILAVPTLLPFTPEFNINAIVSVTLIFLVSAAETIGDSAAVATSGLKRDVKTKEIAGSLSCDGFISSLSGLFGCMPITSFSQNIGLIAMTGVVNRFAIFTGALIMLLAGFFPFIGRLLATLPDAVLGGCTLMMFGSIVLSGVQMLAQCGFSQRNLTIAALSLSIGIGFTQVPSIFAIFPQLMRTIFAENCVASVFITCVVLNLIMPPDEA